MRALLLTMLGLAAAAPAAATPCAGEPGAGRIKVTIEATGVLSSAGQMAFTVYPDVKSRFLSKGGKLARVRTPAIAGTTGACFWLPPGGYPFVLYHDANGDHDFNRTLFVPKEGYGISNDAPTTFGRPSFEKSRVLVGPGNAVVRIRMRYP